MSVDSKKMQVSGTSNHLKFGVLTLIVFTKLCTTLEVGSCVSVAFVNVDGMHLQSFQGF